MKKLFAGLIGSLMLLTAACSTTSIHSGGLGSASALELAGEIDEENVRFTLSFEVEPQKAGERIPLVTGDVALLPGDLGSDMELSREGRTIFLTLQSTRKTKVSFSFGALPQKNGAWRNTSFVIPNANVRKLTMVCDRPDLELDFPGALRVERNVRKDGKTEVGAFLGLTDQFAVRWKPEIRKLDAALVVEADANILVTASVGALRLDSVFNYRVVQGALEELKIKLSEGSNITQVTGADIREWTISGEGDARVLTIQLSRPQETVYQLQVESEQVLAAFPTGFDLPVLQPLGVIRTSGFLMLGTDSAIKLRVDKASGLTQIDHGAFPVVHCATGVKRPRPNRSTFAYQFANMPYTVTLAADDIVTSYNAESRLLLRLKDQDVSFDASVELDVRDAPARSVEIETDPGWTVVNVSGKNVADYDVRNDAGRRFVKIIFREGVLGRTLVALRLERSLTAGEDTISAPKMVVVDAKTERGYLILAAEQGVRLVVSDAPGLREVRTGSVPMRVTGSQAAFRYKKSGWGLDLTIAATEATIYSELFHLISLGEGVLYGSATVTSHVTGAPVQAFKFSIPEHYQNVEFVGADIRSWKREGTVCTVSLQEKVIGDYTMLVTWDQPFNNEGDSIVVGGLETLGSENEFGFIALSGAASLGIESEGERDAALISIDRLEIPTDYAALIKDPVIRGYKYVNSPHTAALKFKRSPTQDLLSQVNDHTTLETRISKEGEAVTRIVYFVKNTSQQYLTVTLPEGAALWSARVAGREVQALDTGTGTGELLIPLPRNPDPNRPSRVEVEFAEGHAKLGLSTRLLLKAPECAAQSIFAEWTVILPNEFVSAQKGGNMMGPSGGVLFGFRGLASQAWEVAQVIGGRTSMWGLLVAVLLAAGLISFNRARKYGVGLSGFVGALLVGSALIWVAQDTRLLREIGSCFEQPTVQEQPVFTKVVSLADSQLNLDLSVVPQWVGADGRMLYTIGGVIAGLLILGIAAQKHQRWLVPVGLTLIAWGVAQLAVLQGVLTIGLLLAILATFVAWVSRAFSRTGNAFRESHPKAEPEPPPMVEPEPQSNSGFVRLGILVVLSMLSLAILSTAIAKGAPPPAAPPAAAKPVPDPVPPKQVKPFVVKVVKPLVVDSLELKVLAPPTRGEDQSIAATTMVLKFKTDHPQSILVLKTPAVLTDYDLNSSVLRIENKETGYHLIVDRKGSYTVRLQYLIPVNEKDGTWGLDLFLPPNLRNQVVLHLPEDGLRIWSDDAVLLKTVPEGKGLQSTAVFGPGNKAVISWCPQVRQAALEDSVVFCEMQSLLSCDAGVVNLVHFVRYQIAQGQIQSVKMKIPENMSVTAVQAPNLSTWRFDAKTGLLEALLEQPVTGEIQVRVVTQITQEGLPYEIAVEIPEVLGASRQRGSVALTAPGNVELLIEPVKGLSLMNIGDFSSEAVAAVQQRMPGQVLEIKRALRYHQLPAVVSVKAEKVLPELRVVEKAQLDISDERMLLSSQLEIAVARAGVFHLRLTVPIDYEVESLSGDEVSHWDEAETDAGREVLVHFTRKVIGKRTLNLVLTRLEKGVDPTILVPRIHIENAIKHSGSLAVSGEQGVRFRTSDRKGVSEIHPRELGIQTPGCLAFRLLRPDWEVRLVTEVVEAVVKAEVLQQVSLSEGLLQGHGRITLNIEGAGIKQVRLKSPQPGLILSIAGRQIAHVQEVDKEEGIWEVQLHDKVVGKYMLDVSYQLPVDAKSRNLNIDPLVVVGVQRQKGYLVVMAGGRVRIEAKSHSAGLSPENARNIPASLGGGDLSDAILCYRATREDYRLEVGLTRHASAAVLPASVESVCLVSVVSDDDQLVTRVSLNVRVGDLRVLPVLLPKGSQIWSVLVNGRAMVPLLEQGKMQIPLDVAEVGDRTAIEFIYGGRSTVAMEYSGPQFDLPLKDIEWILYTPIGKTYHNFEGTMEYDEEGSGDIFRFDASHYQEEASKIVVDNMRRAEEVLSQGEDYARQGNTRAAKQAFEAAMNYSKGQESFNEDARVQYLKAAKEEAKSGLWSRRGNLKMRANIQDGENNQQIQNDSYLGKLSSKEQQAFDQVAEKILEQQTAAAGELSTIQVTLPVHGQRLVFHRSLQIQPLSEMKVSFKARTDESANWASSLGLGVGLLGLFGFWVRSGSLKDEA